MTFIEIEAVFQIHREQVAIHGGADGILDSEALEAALNRPRLLMMYGEDSVPRLAAKMAVSIVQHHPFMDGNKRTAQVLLELTLVRNGYVFPPSDAECYEQMIRLATSPAEYEDDYVAWVERCAVLKP